MESVVVTLTFGLVTLSCACVLLLVLAVVRLASTDDATEAVTLLLGESEELH